MQTSLAVTALLMGLAGGPHCVAMCGAACAGIGRQSAGQGPRAMLAFQLGRLLGYAGLGALAAASVQGLGWLTVQSAALRPVWALFHVAAGALGLLLLWRARQPRWLESAGQGLWRRVRPGAGPSLAVGVPLRRAAPLVSVPSAQGMSAGAFAPSTASLPSLPDSLLRSSTPPIAGSSVVPDSPGASPRGGGALALGLLWSLLPCGLLYSALLVAALAGTPQEGAAVMALFALGSAVCLLAGPWLWLRLRRPGSGEGAVRLAGLALVLSSAAALWMGLAHEAAPWCLGF